MADATAGGDEAVQTLETIAGQIRQCTACELCRSRTHAVPGEGDPKARVMLIGEGPGAQEDREGRPFIGNSGRFLTELIGKAGLSRDEVFITNVVKCRPPGNRDPMPDEIVACSAYLDAQIELIDPEVIITLGRFSMQRWFRNERISRIHGEPREDGGRLVVPMFHPAAALHNASLRGTIEDDFAKVPKILADRERLAEAERQRDAPQQEQMRLF
jgi:uracil-DNA glycosylase